MKLTIDGISDSSSRMNKVWNNLWKLNIPSKIKHFTWKALKNSMPNKSNLIQRGINISPLCPICNSQSENIDHCLFLCSPAKELWRLTYNHVFLDEDFQGSFIDRWIKIDSRCSMEELGRLATICWTLWNDRNKVFHGEQIPPITIRSKWIIHYLSSYPRANSKSPSVESTDDHRQQNPQMIQRACWSPAPDGFWKLNTDASCSTSPPLTGLGILFRDKNGDCMLASSIFFDLHESPSSWIERDFGRNENGP